MSLNLVTFLINRCALAPVSSTKSKKPTLTRFDVSSKKTGERRSCGATFGSELTFTSSEVLRQRPEKLGRSLGLPRLRHRKEPAT